MRFSSSALATMFLLVNAQACRQSPSLSTPEIYRGKSVAAASRIAKATVALVDDNGTGGLHAFCTGTLIGPRRVLTASHCVQAVAQPNVAFGLGFLPLAETPVIHGQGYANPDFQEGADGYTTADVAVVELEQDAPADAVIATVAEPGDAAIGQVVTLAGYGTLGFNDASRYVDNGATKLYQTRVTIESFDATRKQLIVYKSTDGSSACAGDSGGPMFAESSSGALTVLGATRGPVIEDSKSLRCIGRGTYTNAAVFKDWINGSH